MNSDSPLYLQCLCSVYSYEKLLFVVYVEEFQLVMFSVESSMNAPPTCNAKFCQFSSAVFEKFKSNNPHSLNTLARRGCLSLVLSGIIFPVQNRKFLDVLNIFLLLNTVKARKFFRNRFLNSHLHQDSYSLHKSLCVKTFTGCNVERDKIL